MLSVFGQAGTVSELEKRIQEYFRLADEAIRVLNVAKENGYNPKAPSLYDLVEKYCEGICRDLTQIRVKDGNNPDICAECTEMLGKLQTKQLVVLEAYRNFLVWFHNQHFPPQARLKPLRGRKQH